MFKSTLTAARAMQRDQKGSVAIMFGLSVIALGIVTGMAFDVGRAFASKSKVTAAVDAATLAAAKGIRLDGLTDDQAIAKAKLVFAENMRKGAGNWTNVQDVRVTIDRSTSRVRVEADTYVETTLAKLTGVMQIGAPGAATALFEGGNIEVAVQLDLTGSMCNGSWAPCTNDTKIQGLKDATKDLVDLVIPDNPGNERVRIAFAPFTAGVNLGAYQAAVTGNRSTADGCVYERMSSTSQATDLAPTGSDRYMVRSDLQAAPHNVANPRSCPTAAVVPLTDRKQVLKDTVDSYVADGFTGGHNGTAWTWNLLSPNFSGVWPSDSAPEAYGPNVQKVAVLMTDGEYNTMNGRGRSATDVSAIAVDTCNAMKSAGIRVYTVGFALGGNATAINTLSACATTAGDFYQAATAEELRAAFRNIAANIMRLRLTN
jgi:Flp pilus assembly protein TadG